MSLDEFRELFFLLALISIIAIFVHFIYWNILYLYLRKYDPILFKEPYFSTSELSVYRSWPLSLIKATSYILLLTNSRISRKRFSALTESISESKTLIFLCHFWKILLALIIFIVTLCVIWVGIDMAFIEHK